MNFKLISLTENELQVIAGIDLCLVCMCKIIKYLRQMDSLLASLKIMT